MVGAGQRATLSGALSHSSSITLPSTTVEALQKEWEDTLTTTKDARREVKEEQLAAAMVDNVCDAAQVEAACLREELEGVGCSLPFSLFAGPGLRAALMAFNLDASCPCQCRGEGGDLPLGGAASRVLGGGG